MPTELQLLSPAKLNLFLHITHQRPDGYHALQTLFQLLDYGDNMHFSRLETPTIELSPDIKGVAHDNNLIVRAAKLLQQQAQCQLGAAIHIDKILPMGGGIGGGSSNAATTLLALNKLWALDYSIDQLADLGVQLGADVPVFIRGKSAWAEGIGERLKPVEIPDSWYLVLKPDCEVITAKIFLNKQLTRRASPITIAAAFEQRGLNVFEPVVRALYPDVDFAFNWLNQYTTARLTGTGACVYASFTDQQSAKAVLEKIPAELKGFVARGVNTSPVYGRL